MGTSSGVFERARRGSLIRGVVLIVAVVALVAGACGSDKKDESEGDVQGATESGFVIESSDKAGPDAFTAPVDTNDGACDPEKLVEELDSRPAAKAEWARVLGIDEEEVEDYIQTLEPKILETDTMVTNHGLHNNTAYARPSVLEEGTAVLVDPQFSLRLDQVLPPELFTTTTRMTTTTPPEWNNMRRAGNGPTSTTTTTVDEESTTTVDEESTTTAGEGSTTTVPEEGQPVTRCKCGNPLLPAYAPAAPGPPRVEEPGTTTTTTLGGRTTTTDESPRATQVRPPSESSTSTTAEEEPTSTTPSSQPTSSTGVVTPSLPPNEQQGPS